MSNDSYNITFNHNDEQKEISKKDLSNQLEEIDRSQQSNIKSDLEQLLTIMRSNASGPAKTYFESLLNELINKVMYPNEGQKTIEAIAAELQPLKPIMEAMTDNNTRQNPAIEEVNLTIESIGIDGKNLELVEIEKSKNICLIANALLSKMKESDPKLNLEDLKKASEKDDIDLISNLLKNHNLLKDNPSLSKITIDDDLSKSVAEFISKFLQKTIDSDNSFVTRLEKERSQQKEEQSHLI